MTGNSAGLEERSSFKNTPQGQYQYWQTELNASKKMVEKWHRSGDQIVNRYLGEPHKNKDGLSDNSRAQLNLFHSNVTTLESMLYGNTPKIDVSRRYADANDDQARVAAEAMERLLNLDMTENSETIDAVFRSALQDRLLPGLGVARARYEVTTGKIKEKAMEIGEDGVTEVEVEVEREFMIREEAPVDYWFWGDVLWSWSRNWSEVRWVAFKNYLRKEEIEARFGKDAADNIPLKKQMATAEDTANSGENSDENQSAWMKGEIWEIWDKDKRQVVWVALGYDKVLQTQDDPLKLANFFPCPQPLVANPTTRQFMPVPDFKLAQDLYNEIDLIHYRITILTQAVKAMGLYAGNEDGIQRIFEEGEDNKLIPVENWSLFGEKGGIAGQVDWVPIADIVNALDKLRELRAENIALLQQITGMADVMRGELSNQYEGVGQSQLKAKFGSVRVQALQDQFAHFASGLMQIKAEIIARHFSPETIVKMSNMENSMEDAEAIGAAVALIKEPEKARLRVTIRPESVAMVDYAALQEERSAFMNALSTYMQSAAPLIEADPAAQPFLLQLLQWVLSGFKGSQEIEGVIDKAIQASLEAQQEAAANPEPSEMDTKLAEVQAKGQIEIEKQRIKTEGDLQLRMADLQADMQTAQRAHEQKMAEIFGQLQAKLTEIEAKMRADIVTEQVETEANLTQVAATAGAEIQKDTVNAELESAARQEDTAQEIAKIGAQANAKINEEVVKGSIDMSKQQASEQSDEE